MNERFQQKSIEKYITEDIDMTFFKNLYGGCLNASWVENSKFINGYVHRICTII